MTSELSWVCQSTLPSAGENAWTCPLRSPTTTISPLAAGPPDHSRFLSLTDHSVRPFEISRARTSPSTLATNKRSPETAGCMRAPDFPEPLPIDAVHSVSTLALGANSTRGVGGTTLSFLPRPLIQLQPPSASDTVATARSACLMTVASPPPAHSGYRVSSRRNSGSATACPDASGLPCRRLIHLRHDRASPAHPRAVRQRAPDNPFSSPRPAA